MEFRFTLSLHRWIITAYGIFGVVFLLGILTLPYLFAGWLAPEEAKSRIHEYLLWQVSLQHMAELKEHGLGSPDTGMALRWVAQIDRVKTLEFVSVAVKRALFVPPFRRRTNFVVRVVLRDGQQQNQSRYFWFNGVISVLDMRETSRLAWYLPL